MGLFSKVGIVKTLIVKAIRLRKDLDYALTRIDLLETSVVSLDDDIKILADLPKIIYPLSESCTFLTNKIRALESALIEKEVLEEDSTRRTLN